jgi:hypothetical protein
MDGTEKGHVYVFPARGSRVCSMFLPSSDDSRHGPTL